MTIREVAAIFDANDDPKGTIIILLELARSAYHGEPCGFNAACASTRKWIEHYGLPTAERIDKWLNDFGKAADIDIPNDFIATVCDQVEDGR